MVASFSASVAVAFLLKCFPVLSLEEILHATCPKRPMMFSKLNWWPSKAQSKILKDLIEYEKILRIDKSHHAANESETGAACPKGLS